VPKRDEKEEGVSRGWRARIIRRAWKEEKYRRGCTRGKEGSETLANFHLFFQVKLLGELLQGRFERNREKGFHLLFVTKEGKRDTQRNAGRKKGAGGGTLGLTKLFTLG